MATSWTSRFDPARFLAAVRDGTSEGLQAGAELVLTDSQRRVPFIKGELAASGDSGLVGPTRAAVTYRDPGAIGAHERTDIAPANGRERKFLENALNSHRSDVAEAIASAIRRRLGT